MPILMRDSSTLCLVAPVGDLDELMRSTSGSLFKADKHFEHLEMTGSLSSLFCTRCRWTTLSCLKPLMPRFNPPCKMARAMPWDRCCHVIGWLSQFSSITHIISTTQTCPLQTARTRGESAESYIQLCRQQKVSDAALHIFSAH